MRRGDASYETVLAHVASPRPVTEVRRSLLHAERGEIGLDAARVRQKALPRPPE